ncbi:MAG: hypothetical protein JJE39_15070 [Vicinamibacteria bacterium]|nr:hypothetical protein [Vicinamibacteria bacterium]
MKAKPLDLTRVRTYPLASRVSKVSVADFGRPHVRGARLSRFVDSLPKILGADQLRAVASRLVEGRKKRRPLIWGMGAHVLKVGLAPVVIDLMERGFITAIALNGAGIVHDFETAISGQTSEEVDVVLGSGQFGMARETGEEINRAIVAGDRDGLGLGASVGRYLAGRRATKFRRLSILAAAWRLDIPATVHVALGTDIVHMHPTCDPAAVGRASHLDFRTLAGQVAKLGGGGVYLNIGSAVLLPEVFLKAVTLARNLGHPIKHFTTANFDFIQGYRPNMNVVNRPTKGVGRGYALTGHHEIMIPLLAAILVEASTT